MRSISDLLNRRARRAARTQADIARSEALDDGIGSEVPIRKSEQDRLRRVDFASRIAGVLSELSVREGRIFAIRGGWGFGKSSLKNLITERLDTRDDGADWVDFNPWQWGDGDAIARALFGQIADRLGGEHSKDAIARADALRRYGEILTGTSAPLKEASKSTLLISTILTNVSVIAIASAIHFDLPTAAVVATAIAVISMGSTILGKVLVYLGRDRSAEPLDKVREALELRLRELKRPVVVFVDDIDRLEPDQIRMLLRQVKANANLPNIIFVLIFQPSIVESALDPITDGNGKYFLEKIVQINFDLPAVPISTVHKIFAEELSERASRYATEANGFSQRRWGNAFAGCIQPFLRNMRDTRRLLSSIAVHMPLHTEGNVFEVNVIDFFILETLRVFEPDLHENLSRDSNLCLQSNRFTNDGRRDADKKAIEQIINKIDDHRRATIREILKQLFPQIEWALGGSHYGTDWQAQWSAEKRVCSPRYFPRYFELQTAVGELSERVFLDVLAATSDEAQLRAAIAGIETNSLLPSLVARFDESVDRLPAENAAVLLPAMFEIGQKLIGTREADPFNSPWVSAWRATSWFLKRIPEDIRGKLAVDALRQTGALSVAAMLIHLNDPADREDKDRDSFDPALTLKAVDQMKAEWVRLIRDRASDTDRLITDFNLISLMYEWRDYTGSFDEPRRWIVEAIQADYGFAKVVDRMMSRGTSHGSGDWVAVPYNTFNKKVVEDFIGIKEGKNRINSINITDFPEFEEAIQTLHKYLDKWLAADDTGGML